MNKDIDTNQQLQPAAQSPGALSARPAGESLAELISGSSEAFEFALGLDSSRPEAFHGRAVCLRRLRHYEKAQAILEEALALHHDDPRLLKEQVILDCCRGRYDRALATIDTILSADSDNALAWEWKIATLCCEGRMPEADALARQALHRFPASAGLLAECGYLRYDQSLYDQANELFNAALRLNADDEVALQWKIATLRRLGQFAEAATLLAQAIARFPRNPGLRIERGFLHFDQDQFAEAIVAFDQALLRDRDNEEALQWKISALRLQKRFAEVADLIQETLGRFPRQSAILNERGYLHYDQREYGRAVEAFDQALAVDAYNEEAHQCKVAVLRLAGRFPEAKQALRDALALLPASDALLSERRLLDNHPG